MTTKTTNKTKLFAIAPYPNEKWEKAVIDHSKNLQGIKLKNDLDGQFVYVISEEEEGMLSDYIVTIFGSDGDFKASCSDYCTVFKKSIKESGNAYACQHIRAVIIDELKWKFSDTQSNQDSNTTKGSDHVMSKSVAGAPANPFLPPDYKAPSSNNYMKLLDGKNKFRVFSPAIFGFQWWEKTDEGGKRPRRVKTLEEVPETVRRAQDNQDKHRHFWAFTVFNYADEQVQILELTQKGIMKMMTSYLDNEEYGDPRNYDITIERSGSGLETEYLVTASPPKEFKGDASGADSVKLERLFTGEDPFGE